MKVFHICFLGILSLSLSVLAETVDPQPELPQEKPAELSAANEVSMDTDRDPFAPGLEENNEPVLTPLVEEAPILEQDLVLQGIAINDNQATAIINGKAYVKGKARGTILVVEVRKREVDIKMNGTPKTISFKSSLKKNEEKSADAEGQENNLLKPDMAQEEPHSLEEMPMISKEESR